MPYPGPVFELLQFLPQDIGKSAAHIWQQALPVAMVLVRRAAGCGAPAARHRSDRRRLCIRRQESSLRAALC
jgi:hypothetical protein